MRGVTFQPVQDAGSNEGFDANRDRILLSDIRRSVIAGANPFTASAMIPLPCNPESICIGYGLRQGANLVPITGMLPRDTLIEAMPNTVTFEKYPDLRRRIFDFFSLSNTPANAPGRLEALLCCLPEIEVPADITYDNLFRVVISEFLDAHNFCISRVKRSYVHFVTAQGKIIPFDTYNLFYRDDAASLRRTNSLQASSAQLGVTP